MRAKREVIVLVAREPRQVVYDDKVNALVRPAAWKRPHARAYTLIGWGRRRQLTSALVPFTLGLNLPRLGSAMLCVPSWRAASMFAIVGDIRNVQVIATGRGIRRLKTLRKRHGGKRWRELKGDATVRLANGTHRRAEIHWYEAHGVGKRGLKIKRFLD
jgi:hypothetical protein